MKRKITIVQDRDSLSSGKQSLPNWKRMLFYWLGGALLVIALCYALHRYFEYRERQLEERLERLSYHLHETKILQS